MPNPLFKSIAGEQQVFALYDQALSSWPAPYQLTTVQTKFGLTNIIVSGKSSNPPLFLLHGASSNATSWISEVQQYSQKFQVFAIDVIGEPGKSAPTRPDFTSSAYADWLDEIRKSLQLTKVSIVGLSQGGWIALKYAITYPQIVTKLVLLAPAGIVATKGSFLLIAILATLFGKWGIKKLNRYVFGSQLIDPQTTAYMNAIMEHFTPRFSAEYVFSDQELKKLTMPVLLIGGGKDVIRDNQKIKQRLMALLPNFTAQIIPEAGHVLIKQAARVMEFLADKEYLDINK